MASMTRGTSLVPSVAGVVKLTGHQGLANIPVASELALTDLLVTASDFVYDKLKSAGIDPTALTNAEVYERCVAWNFLAILAELGLFGEDEDAARYQARADMYCENVSPLISAEDSTGNVPRIGNVDKKPRFGEARVYDDLLDLY